MSPRAMRRTVVVLCVSVLVLLTLGIVMLCSTSSFFANDRFGDPYALFKRQAVWLGIGLIACAVTSQIDYHRYRGAAWVILGAAAALLVLVLVIGPVRNGAQRWLIFGPVSFQPSELAKFGLVIFLAFWLERMQRPQRKKQQLKIDSPVWGIGIPLAVTGILAGLIVKQPDLGTTLLLMTVTVFMLWIAGANPKWLGALVGAGAVVVGLILVAIFQFGMFDEHYQVRRIVEWWKGADTQGINFQQYQAMLAFGSGGPLGVGLGESRQKMFYLPEAHTDFILAIIGEELGLFGTMTVVAAFCVIIVCGVLLATRSVDLFGLLLAMGILSIIALQAIINLAVVSNSAPNKGMPLPFISYGGSNLMMTLAAVGVLLNIFRQSYAHSVEKYVGSAKTAPAV